MKKQMIKEGFRWAVRRLDGRLFCLLAILFSVLLRSQTFAQGNPDIYISASAMVYDSSSEQVLHTDTKAQVTISKGVCIVGIEQVSAARIIYVDRSLSGSSRIAGMPARHKARKLHPYPARAGEQKGPKFFVSQDRGTTSHFGQALYSFASLPSQSRSVGTGGEELLRRRCALAWCIIFCRKGTPAVQGEDIFIKDHFNTSFLPRPPPYFSL